jgi:hypothetical protein
MKIEIEFEEVEALRRRLQGIETEKRNLIEKLKGFDESAIKDRIRMGAEKMFRDMVYSLFVNHLGFTSPQLAFDESVRMDNMNHWVGENWWSKPEKIKFTFGAVITNEMKRVFIEIGVKVDEA